MEKWKEVIGALAPGLASAFGGPLAGIAAKVIADKVLGRPEATEEEVIEALSSGSLTGEQILALKTAEQQFQIDLEKIDAAREAAAMADTASARQQTVALAEAGSNIAWAPVIISTVITVGFFAAVYMIVFVDRSWDERVANLLLVLFGALTAEFSRVGSYWLGSSAGSKRSGDAVRKIAESSGK